MSAVNTADVRAHLHVWSDADAALGEYGARATQRYVTGPYQFATLPGVGHWIPEDAPQQIADLRRTGALSPYHDPAAVW